MRLPDDLAAPAPRWFPDPNWLARFEPEWNSLGPNKTRSFSILGAIGDTSAQICCIHRG